MNVIDLFTASAVLCVVTTMTNLISLWDNWIYDRRVAAAVAVRRVDHVTSLVIDNIGVELLPVHEAVVGRNSLRQTKRHTHFIVAMYIIHASIGRDDIGKRNIASNAYWEAPGEVTSEAAAGNRRNCAHGFTTAVVYRYIRLPAGRARLRPPRYTTTLSHCRISTFDDKRPPESDGRRDKLSRLWS